MRGSATRRRIRGGQRIGPGPPRRGSPPADGGGRSRSGSAASKAARYRDGGRVEECGGAALLDHPGHNTSPATRSAMSASRPDRADHAIVHARLRPGGSASRSRIWAWIVASARWWARPRSAGRALRRGPWRIITRWFTRPTVFVRGISFQPLRPRWRCPLRSSRAARLGARAAQPLRPRWQAQAPRRSGDRLRCTG